MESAYGVTHPVLQRWVNLSNPGPNFKDIVGVCACWLRLSVKIPILDARMMHAILKRKESAVMKEGIHPDYKKSIVTCICGNTFETRSTVGNLKLEI